MNHVINCQFSSTRRRRRVHQDSIHTVNGLYWCHAFLTFVTRINRPVSFIWCITSCCLLFLVFFVRLSSPNLLYLVVISFYLPKKKKKTQKKKKKTQKDNREPTTTHEQNVVSVIIISWQASCFGVE